MSSLHQTIEKLRNLKLSGMVEALNQQMNTPSQQQMSFEDRLGLLEIGRAHV